MEKRNLIIYTGGTMGMARSAGANGALSPVAGHLPAMLAQLPELLPANNKNSVDAVEYDLIEYQPLLDSSDMTPDGWIKIAADIEQRYRDYSGFVVIHGTDTLAYTSSALSFFVENTRKPIVVTGSQLPFAVPRSDARNNIVSALQVATHMPPALAQVCVVFGCRILRGNRATKISAQAYDAFDSPRCARLGSIGIDIHFNQEMVLPTPDSDFRIQEQPPPHDAVAVIRLFPGFSPQIIDSVCSSPHLRGIVLEGYGSGNGPSSNPLFLDAIANACRQGIVVVVVAQPLEAKVEFGNYAVGDAIARAGAVSGADMTTEAALSKLYYLISLELNAVEIEARMGKSIAGEMSV